METTTSTTQAVDIALADYLPVWVEAFLVDRKAGNKAAGTLIFYRKKLKHFLAYCDTQLITRIGQLTPQGIREYMINLEDTGHNSGGIHASFRVMRTFLNWYENEAEPEGWKNPIRKVKAPKIELEQLEPCDITAVNAILDTCTGRDFVSLRDRAILYLLLDTGLRANEAVMLDVEDLDPIRGNILVRCGKGRKPRTVFIGKKTRKVIRAYLRERESDGPALWLTDTGERMAYEGLRQMVRRRSERAGVQQPTLHSFRRFFALAYLRNGGDIFTLQKLMGHSDLQILRRYLNQIDEDLERGHSQFGPVDNL
jgi:site-specific recombinase XerD